MGCPVCLRGERLERLSHYAGLIQSREAERAARDRAEAEAAKERMLRAEAFRVEAARRAEEDARHAELNDAQDSAIAEQADRYGIVVFSDEPQFTNPGPFEAFLAALYMGVGTLRGHRGRIFADPSGTARSINTMALAEVARERFFPFDPLSRDGDVRLPLRTFYRIHNTLKAAGCRAMVEHERPGDNPQETHRRPRPAGEGEEAA